jgi:hypothetical protein
MGRHSKPDQGNSDGSAIDEFTGTFAVVEERLNTAGRDPSWEHWWEKTGAQPAISDPVADDRPYPPPAPRGHSLTPDSRPSDSHPSGPLSGPAPRPGRADPWSDGRPADPAPYAPPPQPNGNSLSSPHLRPPTLPPPGLPAPGRTTNGSHAGAADPALPARPPNGVGGLADNGSAARPANGFGGHADNGSAARPPNGFGGHADAGRPMNGFGDAEFRQDRGFLPDGGQSDGRGPGGGERHGPRAVPAAGMPAFQAQAEPLGWPEPADDPSDAPGRRGRRARERARERAEQQWGDTGGWDPGGDGDANPEETGSRRRRRKDRRDESSETGRRRALKDDRGRRSPAAFQADPDAPAAAMAGLRARTAPAYQPDQDPARRASETSLPGDQPRALPPPRGHGAPPAYEPDVATGPRGRGAPPAYEPDVATGPRGRGAQSAYEPDTGRGARPAYEPDGAAPVPPPAFAPGPEPAYEPDQVGPRGRGSRTLHAVDSETEIVAVPRDEDEDEDDGSAALQWFVFILQTVVGAVAGLGIWLGFHYLWDRYPFYAAPAVGATIAVMLVVARFLRRRYGHELDLVTALITVGVGVVLTVLPAAFALQHL